MGQIRLVRSDGTAVVSQTGEVPLDDSVVSVRMWWDRRSKAVLDQLSVSCPRLRELIVWGAHDVEALHLTLPELRRLDLRNMDALRDLRGLDAPRLEHLRISATRVAKGRIPERHHPIVMPRGLVERGKRRAKPAYRAGDDGRRIRLIRELVKSWDTERAEQGVELAAALGDPEVFRGLLEETRLERVGARTSCPGMESYVASKLGIRELESWRLHHNGFFHTTNARRHVRDHVVLRLLQAWGPERALDLSHLTSWTVSGHQAPYVDLAPLPELMPRLCTLILWRGRELHHPEALERLPGLTRLVLGECGRVEVPDTVTDLHLFGGHVEPSSGVRRLWTADRDGTQLARCFPNVEEVQLHVAWRGSASLLERVAELPRLRRLVVRGYGPHPVGALGKAPALEELRLEVPLDRAGVELKRVLKNPNLKSLYVQRAYRSSVPTEERHRLV